MIICHLLVIYICIFTYTLLKQGHWISKSFAIIIYLKIESYIQLKIHKVSMRVVHLIHVTTEMIKSLQEQIVKRTKKRNQNRYSYNWISILSNLFWYILVCGYKAPFAIRTYSFQDITLFYCWLGWLSSFLRMPWEKVSWKIERLYTFINIHLYGMKNQLILIIFFPLIIAL